LKKILLILFFPLLAWANINTETHTPEAKCEINISPYILKIGESFYQSYYSQIFKNSNCSPEIVNFVEEKILNSIGKIPIRHLLGDFANKVNSNLNYVEVIDLKSHLSASILSSKKPLQKMRLLGSSNIIGIDSLKSILWNWGKNENQVLTTINDKNKIDHKIEFMIEEIKTQLAFRAQRDIGALADNLGPNDFIKDDNAEITLNQQSLFTRMDNIAYFRTIRPVKKGELLFEKDLSPINLIETGKLIKVLGESQGIQVKSEGLALGPGSIGQIITIENQKSKRKYSAEVIDYNTVKLQL